MFLAEVFTVALKIQLNLFQLVNFCDFSGYTRSRDYKYGNTLLTIYRKDREDGV